MNFRLSDFDADRIEKGLSLASVKPERTDMHVMSHHDVVSQLRHEMATASKSVTLEMNSLLLANVVHISFVHVI